MSASEFHCKRCGRCCMWKGYVRITQHETDLIADFLKIPVLDFIEQHTRLTSDRTALSLLEQEDGSCEWYDPAEKACMIESVKPGQCKSFPQHWNFPGWDTVCEAGIQAHNQTQENTYDSTAHR